MLGFRYAVSLSAVMCMALISFVGCDRARDSGRIGSEWVIQQKRPCLVEFHSSETRVDLRWTCSFRGPLEAITVARDSGTTGLWPIGGFGHKVGEVTFDDRSAECRVSGTVSRRDIVCELRTSGSHAESAGGETTLTLRLSRRAGVCGVAVNAYFWAKNPGMKAPNRAVGGVPPAC